jgi:CMP-2-keto-3-deoxyoctulosonic acid synthetase
VSVKKCERLEQLRALEHGDHIYVDIAKEHSGFGIDTPEDLERARQIESLKTG